ncbi:prepilin-type N-terminal cleavage/methylation domain-containing protein [Candidatus Peregrinibacteria bacterium]|nr:prepilin-type N-terminal cleavage/methylation domain-containing protein [Candidatus Peregrinibacteria bacterium]
MLHCHQPNHRKSVSVLNQRGFTIAEMILVMGVMAILAVIGGQTYFRERDRFEFNNALIKTLQLIKTVRTYAVTSAPIFDEATQKNVIPVEGYGIHFKLDKNRGASEITLFANTGADNEKFEPARDKILETYVLPKQIDFRHFWFNGVEQWQNVPVDERGPTAKEAVLIFKPPLGEMTIGDNASQSLMELGLQFKNPSADSTGPKKCQKIIIDQVKRFPELTYGPTCN